MISRKKEIRFSQKLRQADQVINRKARLSFFSKFTQRFSAKVGGAAISALIVLHFVSQFIFFQNERIQDVITLPKIEIGQIAEIPPEVELAKSDVVAMPAPLAPPAIAKAERKALPLLNTVKKKQSRESRTERPRRANRAERVFHEDEVATVFPYGRFLTRSSIR